jgi:hypothetical protein
MQTNNIQEMPFENTRVIQSSTDRITYSKNDELFLQKTSEGIFILSSGTIEVEIGVGVRETEANSPRPQGADQNHKGSSNYCHKLVRSSEFGSLPLNSDCSDSDVSVEVLENRGSKGWYSHICQLMIGKGCL